MTRSTSALYHCPPAYLALCLAMAIAAPVSAQDTANSGPAAANDQTTSNNTSGTASSKNAKTLAGMQVTANSTAVSAIAPTQGSTIATQPQSIIGSTYIQENIPPTGDYTDIVAISPSVYTVTPNGSGLMEAPVVSIRGFQDGQYNVTFDGIPWMDSNDFTHHSTSYFMAHDLGQITVDRGPGTGATIGDATFGGTLYMLSKAPSEEMGFNPYVSYGSFNTLLYGFEFDSGDIRSEERRVGKEC